MSLIRLAEKPETSLPFSCLVCYLSVHHGSGQARVFSVYPRRWLCLLGSRAKIYTLQGRNRRFVGDSALHTYFGRAPLLVGETAEQKWYYHLQQAQSLIPYNYIPYTGILVVYSSLNLLSTVLLYTTYYCFKEKCCCTPACTC